MNRKSAFTLIELLVVIAIIAVLAALLFPNLSSMMERSRATECSNNLRSLGTIIRQYVTDTKGSFFEKDAEGSEVWPKQVYRYSKDWKSLRSPFDRVTSARPKKEEEPVPISYGLNEKMFDTIVDKWKVSQSSLIMAAPAVDPSSTGKEVRFKADAFSDKNVMITAPGGDGQEVANGLGTHSNRQLISVLMGDGSATVMEYKKYADSTTAPRGLQQWDPMYEQ